MKKILMTLTLALGAMIAIPAAAQTNTATQQTKECCKEKKACANNSDCAKAEGKACDKEWGVACTKEGKPCAKEAGKACCKDGKGPKHIKKEGKFAKGERKMRAPGEARMGKGMRRGGENPMFKGITLTDDQKVKMQALREKNKTAEKKSKADMKAKSKDEIQKIRAEFDNEMEKILDKDQLKQYKANKAELDAQRAAKKNK